ncbi:hypothetical protein VDG1235_4491 [Verrucomicrobiia bacterium DG1235]|nr:hypothetical protein VDG1235_4491 [Verrucomicrobiae bacterium DG1235]
MNPKTLNFALVVIVFILGVFAFRQRIEIAELRETLALKPVAPPSESDIPDASKLASTPPAELTEPTIDAVMEAEPARPERDRERVMRDLSSMMENPQMNEIMQASQKATLEVMYKDLLDAYDFTPEERSHFMDLLMARQMFRVETSMKMMGGGSSPEEMKLLGDEMKEYDQQVKAEIDTFLNNKEDSGEFEFFEKTIAERMSLSGFKSSMAQAGKPIEPATERQLLEIMADQKDSFSFKSDLADDQNYDMGASRFSDENIQAFENDLSELHNIIAEEAQALLDPEQLAALVQSLEGMRNMQLSQLRMAANMFAPKPEE